MKKILFGVCTFAVLTASMLMMSGCFATATPNPGRFDMVSYTFHNNPSGLEFPATQTAFGNMEPFFLLISEGDNPMISGSFFGVTGQGDAAMPAAVTLGQTAWHRDVLSRGAHSGTRITVSNGGDTLTLVFQRDGTRVYTAVFQRVTETQGENTGDNNE